MIRRGRGLAVGVLVLALTAGCPEAAELLTGPRHQVELALGRLRAHPFVDGPGTRLTLRFVSDTIEVKGDHAVAYARGDADGTYRGVKISCIAVGPVPFVRKDGRWQPDGFPLPKLAAVWKVLDARVSALEHRDAAAYLALVSKRYRDGKTDAAALARRITARLSRTSAIQLEVEQRVLRVNPYQTIVTETYRLTAKTGGEPVSHEGRAQYELRLEPGGWRFTRGLM